MPALNTARCLPPLLLLLLCYGPLMLQADILVMVMGRSSSCHFL
jgi:hypothetical protein